MDRQVPARIANILINALKGGVVPRAGLEYITVGRTQEISAILQDIDMIEEGGASFRFIVGKYGSGKSFLLQTIRNHATARGFAVVDADLSPERRFAGTKGQGLATYKELIRNLSTKSKPDGGALPLILEHAPQMQAEVMDDRIIRLYDLKDGAWLNHLLIENRVQVYSSGFHHMDLEEYFLNRMDNLAEGRKGGEEHV